MGSYSTKKGYIFQEKETSLGKKCIYGMFILSFKKTYKNIKQKEIVISGGGYKQQAWFFRQNLSKRSSKKTEIFKRNLVYTCFLLLLILKLARFSYFFLLSNSVSVEEATCSVRKDVLGNFTKFTGKQLRQSLFFNKERKKKRDSGTGVFL